MNTWRRRACWREKSYSKWKIQHQKYNAISNNLKKNCFYFVSTFYYLCYHSILFQQFLQFVFISFWFHSIPFIRCVWLHKFYTNKCKHTCRYQHSNFICCLLIFMYVPLFLCVLSFFSTLLEIYVQYAYEMLYFLQIPNKETHENKR